MWRAAASRSRQDDATVTPAETAAHDLFERDVASAAVRRRELGNGPHHGCRAAGVQSYFLRPGRRSQRRLESRGDKATRSPAAVFGREDRLDPQPFEQIDVGEIGALPGAVEEPCSRSAGPQRFRRA